MNHAIMVIYKLKKSYGIMFALVPFLEILMVTMTEKSISAIEKGHIYLKNHSISKTLAVLSSTSNFL